MAKVTVTATEPIAERFGASGRARVRLEEPLADGETLEAFVRRLCLRLPALTDITLSPFSGELTPAYRVHVNGKRVPLAEWSTTRLSDGDRLLFRRKY